MRLISSYSVNLFVSIVYCILNLCFMFFLYLSDFGFEVWQHCSSVVVSEVWYWGVLHCVAIKTRTPEHARSRVRPSPTTQESLREILRIDIAITLPRHQFNLKGRTVRQHRSVNNSTPVVLVVAYIQRHQRNIARTLPSLLILYVIQFIPPNQTFTNTSNLAVSALQ